MPVCETFLRFPIGSNYTYGIIRPSRQDNEAVNFGCVRICGGSFAKGF